MAQSVDNTITNSGSGEQNIGQGDHAIGKQERHTASQTITGNISSGTGNVVIQGDVTINPVSRTAQGIPLQRPPRAEYFKGRDDILDELLPLLQPGKAVTLCGPGGIGKTALATQAAWTLAPADAPPACFPDGIIFYSFYGKHTAEEALAHVVRSYDEQPQDVSPDAARRLLASKRALVILDGAEEADNLPALLRVSGGCGVLITSRKRSDAQGELVQVRPLAEQPAEEVFRLHSKAAADDASVQGICAILGGWPVGLRIAGRYLRSTGESAADYLQWLEKEPFKELGDGLHQQDNVALLLRRSVEAVSGDARLALGVAGCLAFASIGGGWGISPWDSSPWGGSSTASFARGPVAAVLDTDEGRTRKAMNELVNYGLLDRAGERWQISHALVHTYAREELALSKGSLKRLAGYYIDFCETQSKAGLEGYARLDAERAHCLRLMQSCLNSGLWQEVKYLDEAMWEYLDRQGHWIDRLTALEMALTAARQVGDRKDEGLCLNNIGYTCDRRGEREKALAYYKQSLPICRELDDRKGEGGTLNNIATIYQQQDKYELALEHYEQSLSIKREIGDREGEGTTLNNIGILYRKQGKYEQALQYYKQCLPIRVETGDKIGEGTTLNNIGLIYRAQGKSIKAVEYYEQALTIAQKIGNREGEALSRWNIGFIYAQQGNLAKAEEHISLAVQIADQISHPSLEKYRKVLVQLRVRRQG